MQQQQPIGCLYDAVVACQLRLCSVDITVVVAYRMTLSHPVITIAHPLGRISEPIFSKSCLKGLGHTHTEYGGLGKKSLHII